MTTAAAPAMSSERFQNTKNRIASLSSKNEEFLDQINKLQHSHSQALTALNSQLETIPTDDSEQNIDNLVNNLKFNQRRSNNLQQQSISTVLRSDKLGTITAIDDSLSSRKSAKLAMVNRTVKELKKIESNGELDRKYFSAENNSDSEDVNENSSIEDKDFENINDRRRILKSHPTLTINTKTTKSSSRLITPESSDSEFDISKAHMPLAPTLGGSRNSLRAARHSSAEHYNGNITERRGRGIFSMDDVIEEERGGSLSDVAEQNEISTENINRMRGKQIISANGRKRTQKYMDENDVPKTIKMHRRPQTDDSYADIPDDNSSVMSTDSYLQIEELRARIQKLESERIDDELMSERKSQRRKKHHSDSISPAALSPDSSQGGTSSITGVPRRSPALAQHQKHLQNAFDMFEKAFTTDYPVDDSSPPPSHSMAMVVSSALSLNQKLRSIMSQMELDGQLERGMKALLKTSDEQVRSLTECLLALAPLSPKRVSSKKMERDQLGIKGYAYYPGDSSLLQASTPSHSTRSISPPIPRISSAPVIASHESQISEHDQLHDQSSRRVSPGPPSDQSSPPNSYYVPQRATSRYRSSSPTLPEYNDSQISATRVLERKSRRSSGTAYSGTNPISSTSPSPPPMQHPPSHYDQPGSRVYYEREIPRETPRELPRLQRFSIQGYNNVSSQPASSAYQRTASRPLTHIRTDELSYPSNHYTRRYPSDGQSPIERRPTPGMETDRRYSRRLVNQIYEPEDGYDGSNGYGENIPERDYIRDDKMGIRRNISNGSGTFRQKMVPAQEQEVNRNVGVGNEESRGGQQNDEINDQNVQVNGTNVENSEENDGYI
ncbi:19337_t:CDS:2 [Rhizophagus irregularis]|nr:19337_t:CDS:2 [Rhizophagus irregularis]